MGSVNGNYISPLQNNPNSMMTRRTINNRLRRIRRRMNRATNLMNMNNTIMYRNNRTNYNRYPLFNRAQRNLNIPNTTLQLRSGSGSRHDYNANSNDVEQRQEKWFDVVSDGRKREIIFRPGVSSCARLDITASTNELCQLRHAEIIYKPAAGTQHTGVLELGIDYNPGTKNADTEITVLQPNSTGTVYTDHCLKLIANRAMKGKSWVTTAPFAKEGEYSDLFSLWIKTPRNVDSSGKPIVIGQIFVDYCFAFATPSLPSKPVLESTILATSQVHVINSSTVDSPTSSISINEVQDDRIQSKAIKDWLNVLKPIGIAAAKAGANSLLNHFGLSTETPIGQVFTIGHYNPQVTLFPEVNEKATAHVRFFYQNTGEEVPTDVIQPLEDAPTLRLNNREVKGFFASAFKVLKQVAAPIAAEVISQFVPPQEFLSTEELLDESVNLPAIAFAGSGLDINVGIQGRNSKTLKQVAPHHLTATITVTSGSASVGGITTINSTQFMSDLHPANDIVIKMSSDIASRHPVAGDVIFIQHNMLDSTGKSHTAPDLATATIGEKFKIIVYDVPSRTLYLSVIDDTQENDVIISYDPTVVTTGDGTYIYDLTAFCNPTHTDSGDFLSLFLDEVEVTSHNLARN
jgi:hypothetical protein